MRFIKSALSNKYKLTVDGLKFADPRALRNAIGRHQVVATYLEMYPKAAELFMAGKLSYRAILAMANPRDDASDRRAK